MGPGGRCLFAAGFYASTLPVMLPNRVRSRTGPPFSGADSEERRTRTPQGAGMVRTLSCRCVCPPAGPCVLSLATGTKAIGRAVAERFVEAGGSVAMPRGVDRHFRDRELASERTWRLHADDGTAAVMQLPSWAKEVHMGRIETRPSQPLRKG